MTSSVITSRYASALVDVVTGPSSAVRPEQVVGELRGFEEAMASSAELRYALASPAVPTGRKRAVVRRLGEMLKLSRIPQNFLFVLIDHRRMGALADIIEAFDLLLDARLGFSRAEVTSARQLNDAQQASLTAELTRLTGNQVKAKFQVDESLIGGVVARIGSTVYDGSVRGQLEVLGRRLVAE